MLGMKIKEFKRLLGSAVVWASFWGIVWGLWQSDAVILSSLHDLASWPFLSWVAMAMVMFWACFLMILIYGLVCWILGVGIVMGWFGKVKDEEWWGWLSGVGLAVIVLSFLLSRFGRILGKSILVFLVLFVISALLGAIVSWGFNMIVKVLVGTRQKRKLELYVKIFSISVLALLSVVMSFLGVQIYGRISSGSVGMEKGVDNRGSGKNIIFLTVDAWRVDNFSHELTPKLWKWGEQGVVFKEAYTPSPWTLPSFSSIMTGMSPGELGVSTDDLGMEQIKFSTGKLPGDVETFADQLRMEGYITQSLLTNELLSARRGFDQGFDGFIQLEQRRPYQWQFHAKDMVVLSWARKLPVVGKWVKVSWEEMVGWASDKEFETNAKQVRLLNRRWVNSVKGRPVFLWVHLIDPHFPYAPPKNYMPEVAPSERARQKKMMDIQSFKLQNVRWRDVDKEMFYELYQAENKYVDDELSRIINKLEQGGLLDNAVVILSSDHGEEFWDHGGLRHGKTLYEEVVRVPLVVRSYGESEIDKGLEEVSGKPVSLLNLMPTVLDLVGLEESDNSWFRQERRDIWLEGNGVGPYLKAIRSGDWKLIIALEPGSSDPWNELVSVELYNLRNDPGEENNVANIYPTVREKLLDKIRQRVEYNEKVFDRLEKDISRDDLGDVVGY